MNLLRRIANAARAAVRSFDAAGGKGRWPSEAAIWARTRQELAARPVLAMRAGYLVENSPSARSIEDQWADNLIGDGPSVRSGHPSEATRQTLEAAWLRFSSEADIEGGDLTEFLRRTVRSIVITGDGFVRLITTSEGALRLQLLSSEQIDPAKNDELGDGGRIIAGVEVGPSGERRAYWIRPQAPDFWLSMIGPPVRVDAADICHVYEPRHAGQVRGISWLTPVATRLLELDRLEDSLLARMRVAALFAGFICDPEGSFSGDMKRDPAELSLEPGSLRILPTGATVNFPDVPGIEGAPQLLKHILRSIAAGSGIPYELMAGDLSDVNYSSAKLGLENFRRRVKSLQASMLVARLLLPVWRRMIALEIVSGRLVAPRFVAEPTNYFSVTYLWPQWASLDPLKDAEADQIALANRLRSRAEIIAARGRDIADVDAENAADPHPLPSPKPVAQPVRTVS